MPVELTAWARKRALTWGGPAPDEIGNVPKGPELRRRRLELGVTLYDLSALCGLTARQVSAVEREVDTRQSMRQRVSDALGALAEQRGRRDD